MKKILILLGLLLCSCSGNNNKKSYDYYDNFETYVDKNVINKFLSTKRYELLTINYTELTRDESGYLWVRADVYYTEPRTASNQPYLCTSYLFTYDMSQDDILTVYNIS